MTQEQKAKAYDEALKWMRELYPGLHGATKEDAEHYFPQLRESESEDERIRKEIIEFVDTTTLSTDERHHRWIAYLEKQEQKPMKDKIIEDTISYLNGGMCFCNSVEELKYRSNLAHRLKHLRPRPKVELSEDVKKTLDEVSHILIGLNYKQIAKDYKQAIEKLIYARPSWKPSEEQMEALQRAIDACESEWAYQDDELRSLLNDLKKL